MDKAAPIQTSFFVKCARKVEMAKKMRTKNLREISYWKWLEYLLHAAHGFKQCKTVKVHTDLPSAQYEMKSGHQSSCTHALLDLCQADSSEKSR